jgi:hypothetical protein
MRLIDKLKKWWNPDQDPVPAPLAPTEPEFPVPVLPTPSPFQTVNYWRAWQLWQQTPISEFLAAARKEAPALLSVLVVLVIMLLSLCFVIVWCINRVFGLFVQSVKSLVNSVN